MKAKYNEFLIGISVTLAIFIVIGSIMWMEKSNIFASGFTLRMIVQDANGVSVGDEVLFKGLTIGSVQKATITPEGIVIILKLKGNISIPEDSKFEIKETSLLGEKAVIIKAGKSPKILSTGQTVYGSPEENLLEMAKGGKKITLGLDKILSNIDSLSGPKNIQALAVSIQQLKNILLQINILLQNSSPHLQQTINDIHELTSKNKGAIDSVLQQFGSNSGKIGQSIKRINRISQKSEVMLNRLEKGQGTLGRLMKDDSLYNNINSMIIHIDSLILDIKQNPKKYFEVKVF